MAPAVAKSTGSYSSGAPSSEGNSSAASHDSLGILGHGEDGETDLLRGNSSSKKEAFFGVLFYIYTNRWLPTDWRYVGLATVLQWVQLLILFFGPTFGWNIDWRGNGWWRFYVRLQLQNAITERGYGTYRACLFGGAALLLLLTAAVLWLHFVLRTKTRFRWQWPSHLLRMVICIAFTTLQTSYLLLFTVAFSCDKRSRGHANFYFPDRGCFAMPHAAFLGLSIVCALLFQALSALFALIETGATEPLSPNLLSLANGSRFATRRFIKFTLPLVPVALRTVPRWEGWINFLLVSWFVYITVRRAPYHRSWLNVTEAFLYGWVWWAAGLALVGIYYPAHWPALTTAFLAGMAPVGAAFGLLARWRLARRWRVAMLFERWTPQLPKREVYRFHDPEEVEVVARVSHKLMRNPATLDCEPIPLWVACAGNALRAGLAQFPDSAYLNICLGTFEAVLRQEPSGGLMFLQKARKCGSISMAERFQCYVREQEKLAKKSKDSDASAIMDATSWAEYHANYRAVIRTHKGALSALKSFWQLLLHSDVSMTSLQRHFQRIERARAQAERSYKAVMERYPNNPRIMRAYSRFLQQVKNDPHGSLRFSNSAERIEAKQDEMRSEAMFSQMLDRTFKDEAAEKMMSMVDETSDAVCVINLEGLVQNVNAPFLRLFGYRRGELEGCNVMKIMPNPFSAQHDSYLRNYATSRVPRILDTSREVVALHKHRYVFGVQLCVTPVTLGGAECFMGVIQSIAADDRVATAYCTASGAVVCVSRGFSNVLGWAAEDVIGKSFASLSSQSDKAAQVVAQVVGGTMGQTVEFGDLLVQSRFGEEIVVSVKGMRAGTDAVRVAKIHMSHADRYSGLLVVSPLSSRVIYANATIATLLGYSTEQMIKMKLHELMPEPYAQLHQKYIKGRDLSRCPGLKCRSGRVVEFKSAHGTLVPALMELTERSTDSGNVFSVKVAPVASKEEAEFNRVSLSVDAAGVVVAASQGNVSMLSLDPSEVAGRGLDHFLDVYRRDSRDVAAVHAELLAKTRSKEAASFRVAAAIRGKRTVPCVLSIQLPEGDAEGDATAPATMHLYRADYLEGTIELDANCKVKKASEEAALIFGQPAAALVGEHVQKILPRVCPGGKTSELLVARGQRGGAKRSIGAVVAAEGLHPDGRPLHVSLQAAESTERPSRYLARVIVPRPISAFNNVLGEQGAASAAGQRWAAAGTAVASGAAATQQPAMGLAAHAAAAAGGAVPPPGCPMHRVMSGGSSLLQRLGVGGSQPASTGACPITHDTAAVLAGLHFPPDSQFADEAARQQAAAIAAGSAATLSRPATGSGGVANPPPECPFHRSTEAEQPLVDAEQPGEGGLSAQNSMGLSGSGSGDSQGGGAAEGRQELEAAGDDGGAGDEEELDAEEVAFKKQLVADWLATQPGMEGAPAQGGAAADTIAAGGAGGAVHVRGRSGGRGAGDREAPDPLSPAGKVPLVRHTHVALALEGDDAPGGDKGKGGGGQAEANSQGGSDSEGGTSAFDSGTEGEDPDAADFSRLKRFKKAYKLLNSQRSRQAILTLQAQLKYVLLALVLAHAACFAVSLALMQSSMTYIEEIDMAGQAARISMSALVDVRNIQYAGVEMAEHGAPRLFPAQNISSALILDKMIMFEGFQEKLYFAPGKAAQQTRDYYSKLVNVTEFFDVEDGVGEAVVERTLWEACQRAINAFRSVAEVPEAYVYNMTQFPDFKYLIANTPEIISTQLIYATDLQTRLAVSRLRVILTATWGLLGGESAFIPLAALYLYVMLRAVALERFRLFATFLYLPRPAVLAQARAEVLADDLENDSDGEDDEGLGGGAAASAAVNMQLSARTLAQRASQARALRADKIKMSRRRLWWMMSPLALWLVVVAVCWILQYYWIASAEERVKALNASERIFIYNARIRFFSNELAVIGDQMDTDTAETERLRYLLERGAERMRYYSDAVLYGTANPYRPLDNAKYNLAGMEFIATQFSSPPRSHLLYQRDQCYGTVCFNPNQTAYYTMNMGMDTYITAVAERAHWLAEEEMAAITVDHPALRWIQATNTYGGVAMLTKSNKIFMYIANFTNTKILQIVVLVFAIVGSLLFLGFVCKPYFRETLTESRKVAELLSYVPQLDTLALMQAAAGMQADGGVSGLARTSSQISDASDA